MKRNIYPALRTRGIMPPPLKRDHLSSSSARFTRRRLRRWKRSLGLARVRQRSPLAARSMRSGRPAIGGVSDPGLQRTPAFPRPSSARFAGGCCLPTRVLQGFPAASPAGAGDRSTRGAGAFGFLLKHRFGFFERQILRRDPLKARRSGRPRFRNLVKPPWGASCFAEVLERRRRLAKPRH